MEQNWLQESPAPHLLETDIRSRSFNQAHSCVNGTKTKLWKSERLILNSKNPFADLNIADTSKLDSVTERTVCEICEKSRKYYCYSCYVPLPNTKNMIPRVTNIPIKIDVIKHAREIDGKVLEV